MSATSGEREGRHAAAEIAGVIGPDAIDDPVALAAADQALGALKRYPVIGADAHAGARWDQADWRGGRALLLGSEAGGLSADVTPHISQRLHLPVLGQADSLNVAVAGGVRRSTWLSHNIS